MKISSEQQQLLALKRHGPQGPHDIYKAAILVANMGETHERELDLHETERNLLEVRRHIFRAEFAEVAEILRTLPMQADPLLEGDRLFLTGQVLHRTGKQLKASEFIARAAESYKLAGENYRELRARMNAATCTSTLQSCLFGELYAFEQEARRENFLDIAATICRTRANELLIAERCQEAYQAAMEAAQLYQLDGYPDDRAVALSLGAIALYLNGDREKAQELLNQIHIRKGKVVPYLNIYQAILQGKKPQVPSGHPLSAMKWTKTFLKSESVPGKIIRSLKEKPHTRDELITKVWGENALDQSYCARLHTAINYLKRSKGVTVAHDGEKYHLV